MTFPKSIVNIWVDLRPPLCPDPPAPEPPPNPPMNGGSTGNVVRVRDGVIDGVIEREGVCEVVRLRDREVSIMEVVDRERLVEIDGVFDFPSVVSYLGVVVVFEGVADLNNDGDRDGDRDGDSEIEFVLDGDLDDIPDEVDCDLDMDEIDFDSASVSDLGLDPDIMFDFSTVDFPGLLNIEPNPYAIVRSLPLPPDDPTAPPVSPIASPE